MVDNFIKTKRRKEMSKRNKEYTLGEFGVNIILLSIMVAFYRIIDLIIVLSSKQVSMEQMEQTDANYAKMMLLENLNTTVPFIMGLCITTATILWIIVPVYHIVSDMVKERNEKQSTTTMEVENKTKNGE